MSGHELQAETNPAVPGRERSVRLGGEGTPRVAEFACVELGARVQLGAWSARNLIADALDVRHRLPSIWRRVVAREARVGWVRMVARKTRHLSVDAAAYVDAAMGDFVDGSLPWGRFEARLDGKVVAADPEVAAASEAARAAEQCAKRTRAREDGMAGFFISSTCGVIARIDATVAYVAEALAAFGDTDPLEERRVKAVLVLCNPARAVELLAAYAAVRADAVDVPLDEEDVRPEHHDEEPATADAVAAHGALERMDAFARRVGFRPTRLPFWLDRPSGSADPDPPPRFTFDWSKLLPPLTLNLHMSLESLRRGEGGVVRWESECPVTEQFVHDHLRPMHAYRIQPVIDLAGMPPVDGYEIPDRHRAAVRLRTPADASPFAASVATRVDEDHTLPFRPGESGQTRVDNLAPLGRFGHRVKTHGSWTVRQPFNGIILWRDPHGQVYLVDHTGTHKITAAGRPAGPAHELDPEIIVSGTAQVIELDFDRDWKRCARRT